MDAVIDDQELEARLFALEPAVAAAVGAMLAELCRSDDAGSDGLARTDLKAASRLLLKIALEHLTAAYGRTNAIGGSPRPCPGRRCRHDRFDRSSGQSRSWRFPPLPEACSRGQHARDQEGGGRCGLQRPGARNAARRGDTLSMRRDVVSAGLSMVLGAGDLLEMGLQDETATVICRQAYQDLLHGLLDAALASEAEGPDPGRTEAGRPVRPGHMTGRAPCNLPLHYGHGSGAVDRA